MRTLNGGKRIRDGQNELIFEFTRFVRAFRPKTVMLENVPGLADNYRVNRFVRDLERLGYSSEYRVVDAADFGVPQRRRRMILLASRGKALSFPECSLPRTTVAAAIGGLPPPGDTGDALHDLKENRAQRVVALIRHIPLDGGSRKDAPRRFLLECHRRLQGFYDVYGRMAWNDVAPTITSGCHNPSKGRFLHPSHDRAITLREAALLQTFPPGYYFSMARGKEHVALLIGNALPPLLIKRVALPIAQHLTDANGR